MFSKQKGIFMQSSIIALVSSDWGVARFTTDSYALIAFGILAGLPILLLKYKVKVKNIWSRENALSNR